MENTDFIYSASAAIFNISNLILIAACIVLFTKKRALSTSLMLIGSILTLISSLSHLYLNFFLLHEDIDSFMKYSAFASIFSGISYFIFCLGILLFVTTDFKKEVPKNEFLD